MNRELKKPKINEKNTQEIQYTSCDKNLSDQLYFLLNIEINIISL